MYIVDSNGARSCNCNIGTMIGLGSQSMKFRRDLPFSKTLIQSQSLIPFLNLLVDRNFPLTESQITPV